jgi:hypothetical protein
MNESASLPIQFFGRRALWIGALMSLLVAGLAIRVYDVTDLPLDLHPTRQLLSAIKARGMYYQNLPDASAQERNFAVREWRLRAQVEPEVFERIVAFLYRFTGEQLWVPRILSSLFWLTAACFVFLLAKELVSTDGALLSLALTLLLPYGLFASRSFQPDPLMIMFVTIFWWGILRWSNATWPHLSTRDAAIASAPSVTSRAAVGFAWVAGLAGGLAIFIKFTAVFLVVGGGLGAILGRETLSRSIRRPQMWLIALLGLLPGALYLVYGVWVAGYLGQQFEGRFIAALFLDRTYYSGWLNVVNLVIGPGGLVLGLLGIAFFRTRSALRFVGGLWAGYMMLGLYFNYHISTHDYYSLPLVPIAALSAAPLGALVLSGAARLGEAQWGRLFVTLVLFAGLFASLWDLRGRLSAVDYRPEARMWAEIGERLGPDARVLALTEDYGLRLTYWGWLAPRPWPTLGDLRYHALRGARSDFDQRFDELSANRDYFLVTDFAELDRQTDLQKKLLSLRVLFREDRYLVLDLAG